MPAQLVSLTEGPSILLDKPILLLGRHPECDIQIDSRKISRRHCCIAQVADYLVVRDLGSTNGIRINGSRVLEGRLRAEDELTIGGFRYRVSWDDSAPMPARSLAPGARGDSRKGSAGFNLDDMLEACDEPVALADPVLEPCATPRHNQLDEPRPKAEKFSKPALPVNPPPEEPPGALAIPEHLKLAPVSDMDVAGMGPSSKD